jgi:hypothetical protein
MACQVLDTAQLMEATMLVDLCLFRQAVVVKTDVALSDPTLTLSLNPLCVQLPGVRFWVPQQEAGGTPCCLGGKS